jgi:hypothetical protein
VVNAAITAWLRGWGDVGQAEGVPVQGLRAHPGK